MSHRLPDSLDVEERVLQAEELVVAGGSHCVVTGSVDEMWRVAGGGELRRKRRGCSPNKKSPTPRAGPLRCSKHGRRLRHQPARHENACHLDERDCDRYAYSFNAIVDRCGLFNVRASLSRDVMRCFLLHQCLQYRGLPAANAWKNSCRTIVPAFLGHRSAQIPPTKVPQQTYASRFISSSPVVSLLHLKVTSV